MSTEIDASRLVLMPVATNRTNGSASFVSAPRNIVGGIRIQRDEQGEVDAARCEVEEHARRRCVIECDCLTDLLVAVLSERSQQARGCVRICGHGPSNVLASSLPTEEGENVGVCVLVERHFLAHFSSAVPGHFNERGAVPRHRASLPVELGHAASAKQSNT